MVNGGKRSERVRVYRTSPLFYSCRAAVKKVELSLLRYRYEAKLYGKKCIRIYKGYVVSNVKEEENLFFV